MGTFIELGGGGEGQDNVGGTRATSDRAPDIPSMKRVAWFRMLTKRRRMQTGCGGEYGILAKRTWGKDGRPRPAGDAMSESRVQITVGEAILLVPF